MTRIIKGATLSYPSLWEKNKGPNGDSANPAYDVVVIVSKKHPQVAEIRKDIDDTGTEKFGKAWPKLKAAVAGTDHETLKDGDKKLDKDGEVKDGYAGCYYFKAKSRKKRPMLRNKAKEIISPTEEIIDELFYGGVTADVEVNWFAYDQSGKKSVSAGLVQLRSHERGEAFGGAKASDEDAFDDVDEDDDVLG